MFAIVFSFSTVANRRARQATGRAGSAAGQAGQVARGTEQDAGRAR